MSEHEFPRIDINDLAGWGDDTYYEGNFGFDGVDWNATGLGQPYPGVDVQGDLNSYPDSLTPDTAPISLNPDHGVICGGKLRCTSC